MAVYRFSALSDGQAISFNPDADVLNFDERTVSAASLRITVEGANTRVSVVSGAQAGKDVFLQNVSPPQLAGSNVTFANGSQVLFGDASSSTGNDNAANTLNGGVQPDLIAGLGGNDTLFGGDGADVFFMSSGGAANYGIDSISGGNGFDVLDFSGVACGPVAANISATGTLRGGGADGGGSATLVSIEGVIGGDFNDMLIGGGANNLLAGGAGNDSLDGSSGNDTLQGGTGTDRLRGGAGNDQFVFAEAAGGANADQVTDFASGLDKVVLDRAAHASLGANGNFAAGDARFFAAAGASAGQDADDRVIYNSTTGQLFYDADGNGSGASLLIATLLGAPSLAATDISVVGQHASAPGPITGTEGNDSLTGTAGNDSIEGRGGNDTLAGGLGDDSLAGGAGNDVLTGQEGADVLRGGDGDDTLDGAFTMDDSGESIFEADGRTLLPGDTMDGGLGNDLYLVQANDVVSDPGGIDTIRTDLREYTLPAGFENLGFAFFEQFFLLENVSLRYAGNELDNNIVSPADAGDTLDGGAGNDTLTGGSGDTTFRFSLGIADYGHDQLDGRGGTNTIDLSLALSPIVANLRAGTLTGGGAGGAGSATLANIQGVAGTAFADRIIGSPLAWRDSDFGVSGQLFGGAGNDTIEGVAGAANLLSGGDGDDRLIARGDDEFEGGQGADSFVFARTPGTAGAFNTGIADYTSGSDRIVLDTAFHAGIGASGNFAAGDERFYAAAGATAGHDATDRVIYNTSTGELFYDADGSGARVSELVTRLAGAPALRASDITAIAEAPPPPPEVRTFRGTDGNDSLTGAGSNDSIDGLAGNDTIMGLAGDDTMAGGAGDDVFFMWNGGGAVSIGADSIDGGSGFDTIDFHGLAVSVTANISAAGTVTATGLFGAGSATVASIEGVIGGDFNDRLIGGGAANLLVGNHGNDTLDGSSGNDTLRGGLRADNLRGGAGNDQFVFAEAAGIDNADLIRDFLSGTDELVFENAVLTGLGAAGSFGAGDARFFAGAGAASGQDPSDRLVYDTSTGKLYYDADGSGGGAAQLIATFSAAPVLTATDITVI